MLEYQYLLKSSLQVLLLGKERVIVRYFLMLGRLVWLLRGCIHIGIVVKTRFLFNRLFSSPYLNFLISICLFQIGLNLIWEYTRRPIHLWTGSGFFHIWLLRTPHLIVEIFVVHLPKLLLSLVWIRPHTDHRRLIWFLWNWLYLRTLHIIKIATVLVGEPFINLGHNFWDIMLD